MIPDTLRAHGMGLILDEPIAENPVARLSRLADRTAQRAGHTASLAAKARDEPEAVVLAAAEEVIRCLMDDLTLATLRCEDMRKTAERWLTRADENLQKAKLWRERALRAEKRR